MVWDDGPNAKNDSVAYRGPAREGARKPGLIVRKEGDVDAALKECRSAFGAVAVFSAAVNMLMLVGPLYMLQIYDRVLSSRSVPTLIALSLFLVGAYGFQAVLDLVRSRVVVRSAALLDPETASLGQTSGLLPASIVPLVPASNLGQFGYALNVGTSPPSLRAAQAHDDLQDAV